MSEDNILLIKDKECLSYPKPTLQLLARNVGVSDKGIKSVICKRLADTLKLN